MNDIRMEIKRRARLAQGLLNLLIDDVSTIKYDIDNNDMIDLAESIREVKKTMHKFNDNISELEYLAYTVRRDASRDSQPM